MWHIIYHEKKRTMCAFLVLFHRLLGMVCSLARRLGKEVERIGMNV